MIRRLKVKHFDASEYIDRVIASDTIRRNTQSALDANLAEINQRSKSIGALMKAGKEAEAE